MAELLEKVILQPNNNKITTDNAKFPRVNLADANISTELPRVKMRPMEPIQKAMQRIQTKNHEFTPPYRHNIKLPYPYVPTMSYPTPKTTINNSYTFDPQTNTPVYMHPNKRVHLPIMPLGSYPMQTLSSNMWNNDSIGYESNGLRGRCTRLLGYMYTGACVCGSKV